MGLFCQERNRKTVLEMPAALQNFELLLCLTAQATFPSSLSCIFHIHSFKLHALIPIPWLKMIAQQSFHKGSLPCGSSLLKQPRNSCWAQQQTLPALEFVLHGQGNRSLGTASKAQVMQPRPLRGRIWSKRCFPSLLERTTELVEILLRICPQSLQFAACLA